MMSDEAAVRPRGAEVKIAVDPKGVLIFAADKAGL